MAEQIQTPVTPSAPPPAPAATEQQQPTPGRATPEPLPEEVDIDLGADAPPPPADAAPPAAAPAPADTPPVGLKPKPTGRGENRVHQTRLEMEEAQRRAEQAEAERERAVQVAIQVAERERRANIAAMTHYEALWDERQSNAKAALNAAIDAGDAKLQAEAMAKLSEAQSNLSNIRQWKAANPQAMQPRQPAPGQPQVQPQPQRQQQPSPQRGQVPQVDPATEAWVKANPWFSPESDQFNEELHIAAVNYGALLERRLIAAGQQDQIATPAYFQQVEAFLQREYPDAFEGAAAPPAPAARNGGAPVAPASRGPAPGAPPPKSGNTVRLTGDQRALAWNMADNGALKNQDGSRMTRQQAEVAYAKQIRADQLRQKEV